MFGVVTMESPVEFMFVLCSVAGGLYELLPKIAEMYERRSGTGFSDEG